MYFYKASDYKFVSCFFFLILVINNNKLCKVLYNMWLEAKNRYVYLQFKHPPLIQGEKNCPFCRSIVALRDSWTLLLQCSSPQRSFYKFLLMFRVVNCVGQLQNHQLPHFVVVHCALWQVFSIIILQQEPVSLHPQQFPRHCVCLLPNWMSVNWIYSSSGLDSLDETFTWINKGCNSPVKCDPSLWLL